MQDLEIDLSSYDYIIGIDEVGTGAIAGPIFVGAAVYKPDFKHESIKDSKAFTTEKAREKAFQVVNSTVINAGHVIAWPEKLCQHGQGPTLQHLFLDLAERMISLYPNNSIVIIDGANKIKRLNHPQMNIVKADVTITAVSAASINAKYRRDLYMHSLNGNIPEYEWGQNKGYGTQQHWKAIEKYGVVPRIHRLSIEKVKECLNKYGEYHLYK